MRPRWLERERRRPPRALHRAMERRLPSRLRRSPRGRTPTAHFRDYAENAVGQAARALAEGFVYQGEAEPASRHARAASPPLICRPKPSSPSCRTTTRSATGPMGDRAGRAADRDSARVPALRHRARPTDPALLHGRGSARRARPSRSSATSRAISATRCARADARSSGPSSRPMPARSDDLPDPLAEATFQSAKLDWARLWRRSPTARHLARFRELMAAAPATSSGRSSRSAYLGSDPWRAGGDALAVTWRFAAGSADAWRSICPTQPGPIGVPRGDARRASARSQPGRQPRRARPMVGGAVSSRGRHEARHRDLSPAAQRRTSLRRCRGARRPISRRSASAISTCRRSSRHGPARSMATTSSIRRASIPSSAARPGFRSPCRGGAQRGPRRHPRHRAEPHGGRQPQPGLDGDAGARPGCTAPPAFRHRLVARIASCFPSSAARSTRSSARGEIVDRDR